MSATARARAPDDFVAAQLSLVGLVVEPSRNGAVGTAHADRHLGCLVPDWRRAQVEGSRMSFYQRHALPRLLHMVMQQEAMVRYRRRVIGAAEGRVLEVDIGSGLNLPLYGPPVRAIIGLDPSPELLLMARERAATAPVPVELLEASAETVPLDDASIDTVVTTWTLCTIPDAPRALSELRRVLQPGGALLLAEHGRAPEPGVARWEDRLDPLWRRLAGGCHLNRKIDDLISGSGFRIDALTNARLPGLRTHTPFCCRRGCGTSTASRVCSAVRGAPIMSRCTKIVGHILQR